MLGPILRGQTISLEPPADADLSEFRSWLANLEVTRHLLARFPPSEKQEEEWYERTASDEKAVSWKIVAEGATIGITSLESIDWISRNATSGTLIGVPSEWGKGYGSEAVRLRTGYAFGELGLERLETESFSENLAMHRALEKAGYKKIGRRHRAIFRDGGWHDTIIFELLREEW